MQTDSITILPFVNRVHRAQVVALWQDVFNYPADYNEPEFVIDNKIAHDELFWVATADGVVVGTVMAGFDGHRGWIYSLAVSPRERGSKVGSRLLNHAEECLKEEGCFKVNLQIVAGNEAVRKFYEANGFAVEDRMSMGKRLK